MKNQSLSASTLLFTLIMIGCSSGDNLERKNIRQPTTPPAVPRAIADPIDPALRERALAELNSAAQSSDYVMRANAIEGLQDSVGAEAKTQILHAMEDQHPLVRFAAAMAAGTLKLSEARPTALELANDANQSVRVAA